MEILGYLLMGLVGISLGLVGGGGSILTVPILVYVMGVSPILATSYSLFIVGSTSFVGTLMNYQKGLVNTKTALLFGLTSVTTVLLARKVIIPVIPSVLFSSRHFTLTYSMATMVMFAFLMLIASLGMIRGKKEPALPLTPGIKKEAILKLPLYGILVGLVTGFLGAGGGFLLIPVLVLILKMPMKSAVGTSLFIIAINSLIGFAGDLNNYQIEWNLLATASWIAIAGVFAGIFLAKGIDGTKLKKAFGWLILAIGVFIILKESVFSHA